MTVSAGLLGVSKFYLQLKNTKNAPRELLFAFLAHTLLLETISAKERARHLAKINANLRIALLDFLSGMLSAIKEFTLSTGFVCQVDGRIYVALIDYVVKNHNCHIEDLIGVAAYGQVESIWNALGLPPADFGRFASRFPPADFTPHDSDPLPLTASLLPFDNSILNSELAVIGVGAQDGGNDAFDTAPTFNFGQGVLFSDTSHWHSNKAILPRHLGGADIKPENERHRRAILKREQRFMANLQQQAATLTGASGAILSQIVIAPISEGSKKSKAKEKGKAFQTQVRTNLHGSTISDTSFQNKPPLQPPKCKNQNPEVLSSAHKLRRKIQAEKQTSQDLASQKWWRDQVDAMKNMSVPQRRGHLDAISRNKRGQEQRLSTEIELYRLNLELESWIEESDAESSPVRDRYTLIVIRTIQEIFRKPTLTPSVLKVVATVLTVTGFSMYIDPLNSQFSGLITEDRPLTFDFVKLVKSKTSCPLYSYMHITEDPVVWQLRLFGEYMDRSMDSQPDHRVAFEPDAWQRDVLDSIDLNESLLVIGPCFVDEVFLKLTYWPQSPN